MSDDKETDKDKDDKDGKKKMPSVTLTKIDKPADGTIRFEFGKRGILFNNIQHARDSAKDRFSREDMEYLAIAICLTLQPNLTNPAVLEGGTITVNLNIPNWGQRT